MQVGEVRVAEDADFRQLKGLCMDHDGWKQEYNKSSTTVWTKTTDVSDFHMVKVRSVFKDVATTTLYDVLHDPHYRKKWDTSMAEGYELCSLNPTNDIGYYCLRAPKPIKNRDFVIQRSWLETGREFYIVNHSVNHTALPPKKGVIRGISYITGYYLTPLDDETPANKPGCIVTYVTQSDPKGKLPVWVVNKLTHMLAPKVMSRLQKACRNYPSWKSQAKHNPNLKPWLFPEQIDLPRLDQAEIASMQSVLAAASADETGIGGDEIKDEDMDGGEVNGASAGV
jgi:hypothetical protein